MNPTVVAPLPGSWVRLIERHEAALSDFAAAALAVPLARWILPRAEGKWMPAQEVEHIAITYELVTRALLGGPGMRQLTSPVRATILRWTVMPYILRTGRFPRVRAPREVRPVALEPLARPELLERLNIAASEFHGAAEHVLRTSPRRRFTHAFFGDITLRDGIRLMTVHTLHHRAFLMEAAGT